MTVCTPPFFMASAAHEQNRAPENPTTFVKPSETDKDQMLYYKIVIEYDKNALADYLEKNVQRLAFFANRVTGNKWSLDDLQQEIALRLFELQSLAQKNETGSFCKIYQYFNPWAGSVSRTIAERRFRIAGPLQYVELSTTEDFTEEAGTIGQNFIPDMPEMPEQTIMLNPLEILERQETQKGYQDLIQKIKSEQGIPHLNLVIEWATYTANEVDELGKGKDQIALAKENNCPSGTIRSRIAKTRKKLSALGIKPEFT